MIKSQQPMRGIFGSHTFTCALLTRGGVCDCQGQSPTGRTEPVRRLPSLPV
ncbi:MAG TPA: hypothetical protein VK401_10820 [Propionibacteriaceae bacterium]|jgi:hypothetical protein|nr:hypothetical protein [Propionibacteriaceae bacterium]